MNKHGVVDARVSLMRDAHRIGELEPALAATLDDFVDDWRAEPRIGRWWESFEDLSNWIDANGRPPNLEDPHSAGLRPWLAGQTGHNLAPAQLSALLSLPQFPVVLESPLWSVIGVLHGQGIVPSRPDDRPVVSSLVTRSAAPSASVTPVGVGSPQLLSYLMFVARTGRQPSANEPSGRWIRVQRAATTLPEGVAEILATVGDWRGDDVVGELFASRHARWVTAGVRAGRKPNARSENVEERACAAWSARVRRALRDGRLSAAEVTVAKSMV